jgi:hypothetical protein
MHGRERKGRFHTKKILNHEKDESHEWGAARELGNRRASDRRMKDKG